MGSAAAGDSSRLSTVADYLTEGDAGRSTPAGDGPRSSDAGGAVEAPDAGGPGSALAGATLNTVADAAGASAAVAGGSLTAVAETADTERKPAAVTDVADAERAPAVVADATTAPAEAADGGLVSASGALTAVTDAGGADSAAVDGPLTPSSEAVTDAGTLAAVAATADTEEALDATAGSAVVESTVSAVDETCAAEGGLAVEADAAIAAGEASAEGGLAVEADAAVAAGEASSGRGPAVAGDVAAEAGAGGGRGPAVVEDGVDVGEGALSAGADAATGVVLTDAGGPTVPGPSHEPNPGGGKRAAFPTQTTGERVPDPGPLTPIPDPAPGPDVPKPDPEPQPVPGPTPMPKPEPQPAPSPVPDPEPRPLPDPAPAPKPQPSPAADHPLAPLREAAGAVLEKHGLTGQRATVYLVLDRSGSMRNYYKDGTVQHLAEQALGLSANLDDAAVVPVVFFSTDVDGTAEIGFDDYAGRVAELHSGLGHMGRTNYHWAINAVVEHYEKSASAGPALVIFQTDGAPTSKAAAEKALCDAARLPIFWQFVGFGNPEAKGFDFLRKLDDLSVPEKRAVDNAGFFHAGADPRALSDTDLYRELLIEFPEWLAEARAAGILDR